jgi:serine/threonine-protein kinase
MPLDAGQVLVNRYRIVRQVGQGGFGAVYRAWDLTLKAPVAIKENYDTDPQAQQQFEQEALLLAHLRHPNLPRVSDHFIIPQQGQYLVMDFVEGKSLGDMLRERGGPLSEAEVLPSIRQICDALEYLHTRTPPVIHRDIKPDNIILTADGRAMLVDFGISKVYDSGQETMIGAKAVTPGYSPPEQYGMGKTDARSDIYSLGVTLYTLLTGQTPPESVLLFAGRETLLPPRQANSGVSPAVEGAILAAMALNMSQRLGNATMLRDALAGRAVAPLPSVARPAAPAPTVRVEPRRGGMPAWIWGVGALLLVVGVAAVFLLLRDGGSRNQEPTPEDTRVPGETQPVAAAPTQVVEVASPTTASILTKTPIQPTDTPVVPTSPATATAGLATDTPPVALSASPTLVSCPGALPTRLAVGDTARVINYQLNVRAGPSTSDPIVRRLDPDRTMEILDGPVCNGGQLWYYILSETIRPRDGSQPYQAEGWLVEESGGAYYLEPVN